MTFKVHVITWQCPECATVQQIGTLPKSGQYSIATIPRGGVAAGALVGTNAVCCECGWDPGAAIPVTYSGFKAAT